MKLALLLVAAAPAVAQVEAYPGGTVRSGPGVVAPGDATADQATGGDFCARSQERPARSLSSARRHSAGETGRRGGDGRGTLRASSAGASRGRPVRGPRQERPRSTERPANGLQCRKFLVTSSMTRASYRAVRPSARRGEPGEGKEGKAAA
jgi:hypothetical protein